MFKKREKKDLSTIDTIISPMTLIEGKITHPKSLRIDGKLIGEVHCEGDVYIGKEGKTEPFLKAKNLIISGEVNGEIFVSEKVYIKPTGKLNGSITSKGIIIDEGGVFIGNSKINNNEDNIHFIDNVNDKLEG